MHYTVEHLISGTRSIVVYYRQAVEHWKEIWQRPEAKELASLASLLSSEQFWFEHHCGNRWVGQDNHGRVGHGNALHHQRRVRSGRRQGADALRCVPTELLQHRGEGDWRDAAASTASWKRWPLEAWPPAGTNRRNTPCRRHRSRSTPTLTWPGTSEVPGRPCQGPVGAFGRELVAGSRDQLTALCRYSPPRPATA